MPTNFPTGLDALTSENDLNDADDLMDGTTGTPGIKHSKVHGDANDAIAALEAKVGIDSSAVATSVDFVLHNHEARHLPSGADPLTTAVAGASAPGDTAAIGTANSLARSDHRHSRESASTVVISDQLLAGTASTVSFTSIAASWRDLELVIVARGDTAAVSILGLVQFNTDSTSTNYKAERHTANAASSTAALVTTDSGFGLTFPAASTTAGYAGFARVAIPNYVGAVFNKNMIGQNTFYNSTDYVVSLRSGHWLNTAAINRIDVAASAGNFIIGSRFTLLGKL